MHSLDLFSAVLLAASVLIFMNVVLRSWYERVLWSATLCLAVLWGIHQGDFTMVKLACASVFAPSMFFSFALQYMRHRRAVARDASTPVPAVFTLRYFVRDLAFWTWMLGLLACLSVLWVGALMFGESLAIIRQGHQDGLMLLGLYALPAWLVPACLVVLCSAYFSVVERWVAWLPLLIAAVFYAVLVMF
jgi:hypothetical protein